MSESGQYYNVTSCSSLLLNTHNIVFLVHGFAPRPWVASKQFNSLFYETKEKILEDDLSKDNKTAVIIVDWITGSKIDLALFLRDVLEGTLVKEGFQLFLHLTL